MEPQAQRPTGRLARGVLGCLAIIGVAALLASVVDSHQNPRLRLTACFSHVGGLEGGNDVTLNGVRVGRVVEIVLDEDQRPCAVLEVASDLRLDLDTSAAIFTKNVLGEKYVAVDPGASDELLASGGEIHYTQSALPIERIMIRLLEHQLGSSFE